MVDTILEVVMPSSPRNARGDSWVSGALGPWPSGYRAPGMPVGTLVRRMRVLLWFPGGAHDLDSPDTKNKGIRRGSTDALILIVENTVPGRSS